MEIDVRDESEEITIIRFSGEGVLTQYFGRWHISYEPEDGGFELRSDEIDPLIKALKKLKEIAN